MHSRPLPRLRPLPLCIRSWQPQRTSVFGSRSRLTRRGNVQAYTELATGLNFWNSATGNWEPSQELFQIRSDGSAIATNGQHSLILAPDIASAGAVDLLNPDGIRLVSNPMGLSFADRTSGTNVLIAQVTNSVGELAGKNSVVYPNAFDSL